MAHFITPESSALAQKIVPPDQIESTLQSIWEGLAKTNRTRASLFNLIFFHELSPRTDYLRTIAQKVVEKFPCRLLFISFDPDPSTSYLKTAVSVVAPQGSISTACDQIDIGVAGSDLKKVPFLILPHLLTDLPICLLWAEDPSKEHSLFEPLSEIATRLIFDSEATSHLTAFARTLLTLKTKKSFDIADLNWARTEGWRDLLATTSASPEYLHQLQNAISLDVCFNARETPFFSHLNIQANYLCAWLTSRLQWKEVPCTVFSESWNLINPGYLLSVKITTKEQHQIYCTRVKQQPDRVFVYISSPNQCDLPYQYILGPAAAGQSLVKEICMKGTSPHYLDVLQRIARS